MVNLLFDVKKKEIGDRLSRINKAARKVTEAAVGVELDGRDSGMPFVICGILI